MNAQELREKYYELYDFMAQSKEPKNMTTFGHVMNEMMEWLIQKSPAEAEAWIENSRASLGGFDQPLPCWSGRCANTAP